MKAPDTHSPRRTNTKPLIRGCSCGAVPVPVTTCRQPRARMRCRSAPAGLGRTGQSFRGAGTNPSGPFISDSSPHQSGPLL